MPIFRFKEADGKILRLKIDESTPIRIIKNWIARKNSTNPENIILYYGDEELDDEHPIRVYSIQSNEFISLKVNVVVPTPDMHHLQVHLSTGKIAKTHYKPTATVASLKTALSNTLHTPTKNIKLHIDPELYDENSLICEMGLQSDACIDVEIKPKTVIRDLKIKLSTGKIAVTRYKDTATVLTLKKMFAEKLSADPCYLCVKYRDCIIHDDILIKNIPLDEEEFLQLIIRKPVRHISVKSNEAGKLAKTRYKPTTSVRTIKNSLAPAFGIDPDIVSLKYNDDYLDSDAIIYDLDFPSDAILDLGPKSIDQPKQVHHLTINVKNGPIAKSRYNEYATVGKVKEVIAQNLGVTPESLSIIMNDKRTYDDNAKLIDLQLPSDACIQVDKTTEPPPSPIRKISIRTNTGTIALGRFKESATVGVMKNVLSETLGTEPENISFNVDEPVLDDSFVKDIVFSSNEYLDVNIEPKATYWPITIQVNDKYIANAKFSETATVKSVIDGISSEINTSSENACLIRNGKKLSHDIPIQSLEVREDEKLYYYSHKSPSPDKKVLPISPVHPLKVKVADENITKNCDGDSTTIKHVKQVIADALHTSVDNIALSYDDEIVNDDSLIKDADAQSSGYLFTATDDSMPESPFSSSQSALTLVLKIDDGTIIKSRYKPSATADSIKRGVARILKTQPTKIILSFKKSNLKRTTKILDLNLTDNDYIYVQRI